jgi:osmotically-inducible protein OsmY
MNDTSFSPTRTSVAISFRLVLGLLACIALGPAFAVTDAALQARIEFQVQHEPRLDGTDVRVITDDGNVVLTGQVRLLSQKMLYGQIAWQTGGTIDVDNEIRVTPATAVSDQKLEEAIRRLLQQHERFQSIDAAVKDGIATVHGTFTSAADVLFLKWRIAEIEGVIRVLIESQIIAQR